MTAIAAMLALGACATATIEDAVPQSALQPTATPDTEMAGAAAAEGISGQSAQTAENLGAIRRNGANTGKFPNLNVAPGVAAPQLSETEKQAKIAELGAAQQQQATQAAAVDPSANQIRLDKLAATHAAETLEQIEGE